MSSLSPTPTPSPADSFKGQVIWIIGASSGIGEALARHLAAEGATLILSARRPDTLEALNAELGGHHHLLPMDAGDNQQVMQAAASIIPLTGRLDRVIFMAAIYRTGDMPPRDAAFAQQLMAVNVLGAIYVDYATRPIFDQQRAGQLVICASVAGFTGLPSGQPYSASKAALINYTESLYAEAPSYLDIKLINPGFVRTRITAKNRFTMPHIMEPQQAARAIAAGLRGRAFEIHFPKIFTLQAKFLRLLPYPLALFFTRRLAQGVMDE